MLSAGQKVRGNGSGDDRFQQAVFYTEKLFKENKYPICQPLVKTNGRYKNLGEGCKDMTKEDAAGMLDKCKTTGDRQHYILDPHVGIKLDEFRSRYFYGFFEPFVNYLQLEGRGKIPPKPKYKEIRNKNFEKLKGRFCYDESKDRFFSVGEPGGLMNVERVGRMGPNSMCRWSEGQESSAKLYISIKCECDFPFFAKDRNGVLLKGGTECMDVKGKTHIPIMVETPGKDGKQHFGLKKLYFGPLPNNASRSGIVALPKFIDEKAKAVYKLVTDDQFRSYLSQRDEDGKLELSKNPDVGGIVRSKEKINGQYEYYLYHKYTTLPDYLANHNEFKQEHEKTVSPQLQVDMKPEEAAALVAAVNKESSIGISSKSMLGKFGRNVLTEENFCIDMRSRGRAELKYFLPSDMVLLEPLYDFLDTKVKNGGITGVRKEVLHRLHANLEIATYAKRSQDKTQKSTQDGLGVSRKQIKQMEEQFKKGRRDSWYQIALFILGGGAIGFITQLAINPTARKEFLAQFTFGRRKAMKHLNEFATPVFRAAKDVPPVAGEAFPLELRETSIRNTVNGVSNWVSAPPGYGKTAFKIWKAQTLATKGIVTLELNYEALEAEGGQYRTIVEQRYRNLFHAVAYMNEKLKKFKPGDKCPKWLLPYSPDGKTVPQKIVLVAEEATLLLKSGEAEGTGGQGTQIKEKIASATNRGKKGVVELDLITTDDEFRRAEEKDSALRGRFQVLEASRMGKVDVEKALDARREYYGKPHTVFTLDGGFEESKPIEITEGAIKLLARLAETKYPFNASGASQAPTRRAMDVMEDMVRKLNDTCSLDARRIDEAYILRYYYNQGDVPDVAINQETGEIMPVANQSSMIAEEAIRQQSLLRPEDSQLVIDIATRIDPEQFRNNGLMSENAMVVEVSRRLADIAHAQGQTPSDIYQFINDNLPHVRSLTRAELAASGLRATESQRVWSLARTFNPSKYLNTSHLIDTAMEVDKKMGGLNESEMQKFDLATAEVEVRDSIALKYLSEAPSAQSIARLLPQELSPFAASVARKIGESPLMLNDLNGEQRRELYVKLAQEARSNRPSYVRSLSRKSLGDVLFTAEPEAPRAAEPAGAAASDAPPAAESAGADGTSCEAFTDAELREGGIEPGTPAAELAQELKGKWDAEPGIFKDAAELFRAVEGLRDVPKEHREGAVRAYLERRRSLSSAPEAPAAGSAGEAAVTLSAEIINAALPEEFRSYANDLAEALRGLTVEERREMMQLSEETRRELFVSMATDLMQRQAGVSAEKPAYRGFAVKDSRTSRTPEEDKARREEAIRDAFRQEMRKRRGGK